MTARADLSPKLAVAVAGLAALGMALAPGAHAACLSAPAANRTVVDCRFAGHEQPFVVPAGVRSVSVIVAGAAGGTAAFGGAGGPNTIGRGAVAATALRVTPGRTLYVLVGGIGGTIQNAGGAGGFNGGANGGASTQGGAGGGGGGASDIRTCAAADRTCESLASRLIVAAGGGGGGGLANLLFFGAPGNGGSALADGTGGPGAGPGGGAGATASEAGAGGPGAAAGRLGAGGAGARGVMPFNEGGGGGGGGWYGGGGGAAASAGSTVSGGNGGGAGSSFGPSGTRFGQSKERGGLVTITYATPRTGDRPPSVRITSPRRGVSARRPLVVAGRASDASGVRAVALRIERLPRMSGACTWLDPVTGLGRGRCGAPPSLVATLRSNRSWRYRVPARFGLPSGSYRVTAYGTDESGIYGNSAPAPARSVRFRVAR